MGNLESVDGQCEMKHHIMPLKVPMPEPAELEERFALVLCSCVQSTQCTAFLLSTIAALSECCFKTWASSSPSPLCCTRSQDRLQALNGPADKRTLIYTHPKKTALAGHAMSDLLVTMI
ncbi:formin-like protein 3 isoform X1 [Tachysurus ichikawai]